MSWVLWLSLSLSIERLAQPDWICQQRQDREEVSAYYASTWASAAESKSIRWLITCSLFRTFWYKRHSIYSLKSLQLPCGKNSICHPLYLPNRPFFCCPLSRLGRSTSITTAGSTPDDFFRPPIFPKPTRHFTQLVKPTYRPTTKVSCLSCPSWMSSCVLGTCMSEFLLALQSYSSRFFSRFVLVR